MDTEWFIQVQWTHNARLELELNLRLYFQKGNSKGLKF